MKDQQINSFHKGMAKDLGHTVPQEGYYIDGENIRIVTDGESNESGIVVSVNGNAKRIDLIHEDVFIDYQQVGTPPMTFLEQVTIDVEMPVYILGYTLLQNNLIVFGTSTFANTPPGFDNVDCIYSIDLDTFSKQLIFSGSLNFNINSSIQAVARYESESIQRIYWTDNINPVRTLNVAADNSEIIDINDLNITPNVAFTRLNVDNITSGGSLSAGMYQYIYRLKSSTGGYLTRFSQPSNFAHIVNGSNYWRYEEDPESTSEYNGTIPGEETNKKVIINFENADTTYDIVELAAIYRTTSTGYTNIAIVGTAAIDSNGSARIIHSSNESNIPISVEEATAFNQTFDAAKTIAQKDNRLFVANVVQTSSSLTFNAKSYRYKRTDDAGPFAYKTTQNVIHYGEGNASTFNNPYNNLDNWWDDLEAAYKYQKNGYVLGGSGQYIDFKFTKQPISGTTAANTVDSFPYVTGNKNADYKSPVIAEKYKGYQRGEVYRFGIVLYDKIGNPGFVNWIADIRFPSVEDVDVDGSGGIYNYTLAQTDLSDSGANYIQDYSDDNHVSMVLGNALNEQATSVSYVGSTLYGPIANQMDTTDGLSPVGNLFALGIEFRLKDLPSEIKNLVGGYSFVRVKREETDKATIAVGALTNYLHYYDEYTTTNESQNWYISANPDLYYVAKNQVGGSTGNAGEDHGNVNISADTFCHISSPEFDFTDNYLDLYETNNATHYVRVLGSMWAKNNNHIAESDSRVRSLVYGTHIINYNSSYIQYGTTNVLAKDLIYAAEHSEGGRLDHHYLKGAHHGVFVGQAQAEDEDIGTFYGVWNIITHTAVSDNTISTKKVGVGEKCLLAVTSGINWTDFMSGKFGEGYIPQEFYANAFDKILVAIKKKNIFETRYSGTNEIAIASSVYISTGHFSSYNPDSYSTSVYEEVFGGDTYVTMYDITRFRKASTSQGDVAMPSGSITEQVNINFAFPVETAINTTLRRGYHFANKEKASNFSEGTETPLNQFITSPVYSSENDIFSYVPIPISYNNVSRFPNRVLFSNVKNNNETTDSFRTFAVGNHRDLDGDGGNINKLIIYNDIMYYLQDSTFGALSINPVSTVKDKTGNNIVLGIGTKVIQDHKNISMYTGSKEPNHSIVGQSGVYWLDITTKKAFHFNNKGLNPISDTKLVKSFFSDINQKEIYELCLGYDYLNNEVLFSSNKQVIVYNELLNSFTSRYTFSTSLFISLPTKLLSLSKERGAASVYEHNIGAAGTWYGEQFVVGVEFLVNKHPLYTKVFDNLEWYVEGYGKQDPFSYAQFVDSDNEKVITFAEGLEVGDAEYFPYKEKKEKMTKLPVPRTKADYRFRDTYIKIKLTSLANVKIALHYVKTLFRISRR